MNIDFVNVLSAIGSIIGIILVAYFIYLFFLNGGYSFIQIAGLIFSIILFVSCTWVWTGTLRTELKEKSTECNHQWVEVSSGGAIRTIYCPACKSEKEVGNKEWNKIQADAEYQKSLEEQGKDE